MTQSVIIVGAGGHASVLADALLSAGALLIGFTDANESRRGATVCGVPVLGDDTILHDYDPQLVVLANGIGTTGSVRDALRREVQSRMTAAGWRFATVLHPSALVSRFATVASGAQLFSNSVVQAGAAIGNAAIVNTAAVVEHDATIGDWTHVASGAVVCGSVTIGQRCFIGAGAVVRQGVRLADDTVVGAGAVVVQHATTGGTLVGVPARPIRART